MNLCCRVLELLVRFFLSLLPRKKYEKLPNFHPQHYYMVSIPISKLVFEFNGDLLCDLQLVCRNL